MKCKINFFLILFSILVFIFFIYSSGLAGDYLFDDIANIIDNQKLRITSLDYQSLIAALWSGDAGPLGRPISMLSFALNYYFSDFDPYYFKITNLIIHLINGILICFISLKIFSWLFFDKIQSKKVQYLSLIVCFIWLIHPINLTSVLYIVQRMTSLSTLFGLLSLLFYCSWRTSSVTLLNSLCAWLFIILSLVLSVLSKESGLLFVGLLYWIELCIFRVENIQRQPIMLGKVKLSYILWSGIAFTFISLIYVSIPYVMNLSYGNRDFNTIERLFSESRVIFYYLKMIFFPLLSDLSLYHDDFEISKSLTQPITTLYSILSIFGISLISLFLFKKFPLILFAWGWFIISHLMESTFISLELIHEHRNYFATIGFIIVGVYYLPTIKNEKIKPLIYTVFIFYCVNLAFTTWQRAEIWSNLVDHAAFEVEMHPKSDRANYQMARIYMKLMEQSPIQKVYYAQQTEKYLKQAQNSYKPANGSWFAQLHLSSYLGQPIQQQVIDQLVYNLKYHSFYNSNIGFLSAFTKCQIEQYCKIPHEQAVLIMTAGLENSNINSEFRSEIYKLLAQYFVSVAADYIKGEEFMYEALKNQNDVNGYLLLSQIYRLQGKYQLAEQQVNNAKNLDIKGSWFNEINIENRNIAQAEFIKGKNEN